MSSDRSWRVGALRADFKRGAGALVIITLLAGCTVVEGDTAALDNMKSKTAAAPSAVATPAPASPTSSDALSTGSLADESYASAGIPIPMISPRHLGVRVASIDPRAGIGALSAVSMRQLAGVYMKYDDALKVAEASRLNTPKEVRRVLKTLRYSEPETLAEGWYAVRAMAAADNAQFAQGVREEVRIKGKDAVLASLGEPTYVLRLPGASAAVTAVMASVSSENERMVALKQRFLDTASRFQKQKWGMTEPMETVKAADASQPSATSTFKAALAELSPVTPAQAYSTTVMTKILSQAARQIVSSPMTQVAMQNDETSSCLNWARLNLNQCIAAAHFPSEEAWCTGTHAIEEVRTCWASAMPTTPAK